MVKSNQFTDKCKGDRVITSKHFIYLGGFYTRLIKGASVRLPTTMRSHVYNHNQMQVLLIPFTVLCGLLMHELNF